MDNLRNENKRSREFHSFGEDEFGEGNFLADAWGNSRIFIVVDRDGDGLIKLSSSTLNQITDALRREYDFHIVDEAMDEISVVHESVGIYVLNDGGDTQNVFSWDIEKYLK